MLANPFGNELAGPVIAWLLTYLLHATFLLGLAWLVSKPLARWSVSAEEAVWKLALVGALLTASLQLPAAAAPDVPAPVRARPILESPVSRVSGSSAPVLAFGVWSFGACLLLAGYGRSHVLLRRRLKNRSRIVDGPLHARLRALAAEAGFTREVRLSCSSRVPVPVAFGVLRGEICVPPRALSSLTAEQQEGMLAHELAHLARRDPLWLIVCQVLTRVFFFQPLNWVACRRLREISEVLSDEWAVSRTGRPLSLAGCLAEVAGWSAIRRSLPVPGMADRPSHLAQRIRRLLDGGSPEKPARRIGPAAAMMVLLALVAAAAPAVSAARPRASSRHAKPVVHLVQPIPEVTVAAQPKDRRTEVAMDHADVVVEPREPELSDQVAQEMIRRAEEQHESRPTPQESSQQKPPKMTLEIDLWGNLRFVPEKPGC